MKKFMKNHIPDEVRMNKHQTSNLLSIHLILLFIFASSVSYIEMRLQSTTGL